MIRLICNQQRVLSISCLLQDVLDAALTPAALFLDEVGGGDDDHRYGALFRALAAKQPARAH